MMKANSVKWCTRKTNSCVHVGQKQWDIGGRHEWREGWSAQHNDTHLRNGSTVQWICRCTAQWIHPSVKAPSLIYSHELCVVTERTRLWTQAAEMNVLCLGRCSRHVPLGGDPEEDTLERLWLSAGLGIGTSESSRKRWRRKSWRPCCLCDPAPDKAKEYEKERSTKLTNTLNERLWPLTHF